MSTPYDRMCEILDQAMTPDIAGTRETHHLPQWAEDLEVALDALHLLNQNPISNEAQRALRAMFEDAAMTAPADKSVKVPKPTEDQRAYLEKELRPRPPVDMSVVIGGPKPADKQPSPVVEVLDGELFTLMIVGPAPRRWWQFWRSKRTSITAPEVERFEGWAAHQFGVADRLPEGHPYYAPAPQPARPWWQFWKPGDQS